jgi:hypothetical protein
VNIKSIIGLLFLALTFASGSVVADQQQDQTACMSDAQTFCGQFIPNRERVAHCLMVNRRRISAACRVALRHFK